MRISGLALCARRFGELVVAGLAMLVTQQAVLGQTENRAPQSVSLIFDTDIGNDVDDVLALGVIHSLQSRSECRLLGVTITKDHAAAAPFVDAINTFYGRGEVPIGVCRSGVTPELGSFLGMALEQSGDADRYPHDLRDGADAPDAVSALRSWLAAEPDQSVVIAQVGFSTNLANLLESAADEHSSLSGLELVKRKVKLLSVMAGAFTKIDGKDHPEYNVVMDLPSFRKLVNAWPTPIVFSGFEVGLAITYPSVSIVEDYRYVPDHPLAEAYRRYLPPPHDRPNWDLTSVLYAVRPERDYFGLSQTGRVSVDDQGVTSFEPDPAGKHRYLIADPHQVTRVREALAMLASQPPDSIRAVGN